MNYSNISIVAAAANHNMRMARQNQPITDTHLRWYAIQEIVESAKQQVEESSPATVGLFLVEERDYQIVVNLLTKEGYESVYHKELKQLTVIKSQELLQKELNSHRNKVILYSVGIVLFFATLFATITMTK